MLAPRTSACRANAAKSSTSAASSGTYTAFNPSAAKPALCMTGESECAIGFPTTPYSAASGRMRRNWNSSRSLDAGICPGAIPSPA